MWMRCFGLSALLTSVSLGVARADMSAQDILKKMKAVYDVKTFQGTVTVRQAGTTDENKPFNQSSVEEVMFKQPSMVYMKNSGPAVGGTQITVFTGKEQIMYSSGRNQYVKQPMPPLPPNARMSVLSLLDVNFDAQSGKLLSSTTVGGKAAYVIQTLPAVMPLSPGAGAQERKQLEQLRKMLVPSELVIDKKDFHLLRVTQKQLGMNLTKTLELTQQTFNPDLPDNVFAFTPPAGAKLATHGAPNVPGGIGKGSSGNTGNPGARVSKGSGNPLPPPHASPGGQKP